MSAMTGHLMRRGMEVTSYVNDKKVKIDIPTWAVVMLSTTALTYFCIMFMIDYTYGRVIPTLVTIESPPENHTFEPIPTEDTDNSMLKDPEAIKARPQFITSSFRKTIQLIQSRGGFRARFRGFWLFLVYNMAVTWVAGMLRFAPGGRFLPLDIPTIMATVLFAQLELGWTHIVISEPSPKSWYRRIPSIKMWKKIAVPTALCALAGQLANMVTLLFAEALGLTKNPDELANLPHRDQKVVLGKSVGLFFMALALTILVIIPAQAALTRVQASLLEDADETIVPFDRSFGGKVTPELLGGTGMIGLVDAWKTFDWSARIRLIKTFAKVFAMQMGVSFFFMGIFVGEIFAIGGFAKIIVPADGKN